MNAILKQLSAAVGADVILTERDIIARYLVDQRNLVRGQCLAVVRPRSTADVSKIVSIASAQGISVVPHGGNTGYCGAATPDDSGRQIVVSLELMNRIRQIDERGFTVAVDAGVVLADAQAAAAQKKLLLPLSLGSEGSCHVGGNVATNAGGLAALRYGITRDLVLGLEVVLSNGRVLDDMRELRKNNTGYDLKHLWIGSEGTLGIVTGVVFKLVPEPCRRATAWISLHVDGGLVELLGAFRRGSADLISSFEYMSSDTLALVASMRGEALPLPIGKSGCLLVELSSSTDRIDLDDLLASIMENSSDTGAIEDVMLATSERNRREMWRIRETIPEAEKYAGHAVKHDISVPLSRVDDYLHDARDIVGKHDLSLKTSVYGHVGDGNIHFNVMVPPSRERINFSAEIEVDLSLKLYDLAAAMGGTFSAEHGVGRLKRSLLNRYGVQEKLDTMRAIKAALDPMGTFNPDVTI